MTLSSQEIREQFPAVFTQAYLNTGTAGPLSKPAAEAIEYWNRRQLNEGRSNFSVYMNEYFPLQDRLRGQFARLFNADSDEVALTLHTTNGMNISTWGLRWQPGDEIVTDAHEHPGGLMPIYTVAQRYGLTIRSVPMPLDDNDNNNNEALVARFARAITDKTRLVSISHVSWKTGAILPVAEIAALAHRHGALIAVDGAQSGGAIPIDVKALDVDFYAIPGQKWLCGPEGTGALYVRREAMSDLQPTFAGYPTQKSLDSEGHYLPAAGAKRFEMGTVYWPGLAGIAASLTLREEFGNEGLFARIQAITGTCREMLEEIPGVKLATPSKHAGLLSFTMEGVVADEAVGKLGEQKVIVRSVHDPDLLRVSTSFYNDESDVLRLRDGLESLRRI